MSDDQDEILTKAKELDAMERGVTSEEANVLERVLEAYAEDKKPKIKDCERVKAMYDKYLAPRDDSDEGTNDRLGEEDVADAEDEMDPME